MSALVGKWDVVVHTFMGDQFAVHDLTVNGSELTGTVMDKGNGATTDIYDGSVDGNKFHYVFKIKIPIGNLEFTIDGELLADGTIKGTSANAMGSFEFTGKKA